MQNRNILLWIIVSFVMLIFCTCDESILRDDCETLDEIELTVKGKFATECDPGDILPARGASFRIIKGTDTIASGNLDETGTFETGPIENSSCGLNNLKIEASYNGKIIQEKFGVLCCDTTLTYVFTNISCEPPVQINCGSIDTTIVKTITSSGDCLMQNAQISDLKNNVVLLSSATPLRIDLNPLQNLDGKIFVDNILPSNAGNSITLNGNQLEIYFNVDRTDLGAIEPITISLPAFCLDQNGNDISPGGTITIQLDATICDPADCNCPFGENDISEKYYATENVRVGTTENFTFTILNLTEGQFGDDCLLMIESIKRADGTDAFTSGSHAWTLENKTLPQEITTNEDFEITGIFTPPTPDEFTNEFEVFTAVYSKANPTVKKNDSDCSFKFRLIGAGCEEVCPTIQILSSNVKLKDLTTLQETPLSFWQKIDFKNGSDAIFQKLQGKMSTDCLKELKEVGEAIYNIELPDGNYCGDIHLRVEKSQLGPDSDDMKRFIPLILSPTMGEKNKSTALGITFIPPDLAEHYNSKHSNVFQCAFDVIATDDSGNEICRQKIHIESEVFEFSMGSRQTMVMEAFSQKSATSSTPSYHVYDIDEYNKKLQNYGLVEALTSNYIDFSSTPSIPGYNDDHSFYFNVDSPEDTSVNFTQKPELFLVNAESNNFSKITAKPVASYISHDDFVEAYEQGTLMDDIFNNPLNTGSGTNFEWSDSRDKASFVNGNGIKIKPYEVYVVWNPTSSSDDYEVDGGSRSIFCGMALVYIASVKSGDDDYDPQTGGTGKAKVTFNVEYPLKYDE